MEERIIFNGCMNGTDFEHRTVEFLRSVGFTANKTGSNDGGIDIVATKNVYSTENRFYIQCKFYNTTVGKAPIQAVHTGADYYEKDFGKGIPVVITNNIVTREARLFAKVVGVEIIADAEWTEIRRAYNEKKVTNPNIHHGLLGLILAQILESTKSPQAEEYIKAVLAEPVADEIPVDKDEAVLKIQTEFDEAEEWIKESSRLYQRASQHQQKGMNIYRDIIIRQIKYG